MAIDYLRLAHKIAAAPKPPAWISSSEEWQAVRAIVGGWLATSSVIADASSSSGFALVDKDTGEQRDHEPGVDVGKARPVAPVPHLQDKLRDQVEGAVAALTPAMKVALAKVFERERTPAFRREPLKLNPRLRAGLFTRGLLGDDDTLTPFGLLVRRAMAPAEDPAKGEP